MKLFDTSCQIAEFIHVIQVFDIVPHEGTLVPRSSQRVRFIFHGSEPMQVKAIALCEVFKGPTEVINVFASADIVQYSIDRQIIDFGQQVNSL